MSGVISTLVCPRCEVSSTLADGINRAGESGASDDAAASRDQGDAGKDQLAPGGGAVGPQRETGTADSPEDGERRSRGPGRQAPPAAKEAHSGRDRERALPTAARVVPRLLREALL